jgi:hypothetical protein
MAAPRPVALVKWTFENEPESDTVVLVCTDPVTQRNYRFELPLHTIPSLAAGLAEIVKLHPESFPDTLLRQFK